MFAAIFRAALGGMQPLRRPLESGDVIRPRAGFDPRPPDSTIAAEKIAAGPFAAPIAIVDPHDLKLPDDDFTYDDEPPEYYGEPDVGIAERLELMDRR